MVEASQSNLPDPQVEGFEWTDDMGEISGFGGVYERACRTMVSSGCKWLKEHPNADPQFKGYKNVFGLLSDTNEDAKALSKVIADSVGCDLTGAMHHAAINHIFACRKYQDGWPAYQAEMRRLKQEKENDEA